MTLTLEVEGREAQAVSSFAAVERALRSLKPYGGRTFAILDRGDGRFLQVAGGQVSATVERHVAESTSARSAWRAFLRDPHPNYTAPVTKHFGAGTLLLQPDEILWEDDVVEVFRQFYEGVDVPDAVEWRSVSPAEAETASS